MQATSSPVRPAAGGVPERPRGARATKPLLIVAWMALAIAGSGGLAAWDDHRETQASREDFAREQTRLARIAASTLAARQGLGVDPSAPPVDALRTAVSSIEEPGNLLAFVRAGDGGALLGTSGVAVRSPRIEAMLDQGRCVLGEDHAPCWLRLSHDESVALGLPPRTSVAGLSGFAAKGGTRWGVVIAATALRHSDREERAQWRLVLGFLFSSGLVLASGTLALRTQRKQLELEGERAIAEAVRERDERLGRADKMATLGALASGIAH
jgi:hypothetical protein